MMSALSATGFLSQSASFLSVSIVRLTASLTEPMPVASWPAPSTAACSSVAPMRPHSLTIISATLARYSDRPRSQGARFAPPGSAPRVFAASFPVRSASASRTLLTPPATLCAPDASAAAPSVAPAASAAPIRPHSFTAIRAMLPRNAVMLSNQGGMAAPGGSAPRVFAVASLVRSATAATTEARPSATLFAPLARLSAAVVAPASSAAPMRAHSAAMIRAILPRKAVILSNQPGSAAPVGSCAVTLPASRMACSASTTERKPPATLPAPLARLSAATVAFAASAAPIRPHSLTAIRAMLPR